MSFRRKKETIADALEGGKTILINVDMDMAYQNSKDIHADNSRHLRFYETWKSRYWGQRLDFTARSLSDIADILKDVQKASGQNRIKRVALRIGNIVITDFNSAALGSNVDRLRALYYELAEGKMGTDVAVVRGQKKQFYRVGAPIFVKANPTHSMALDHNNGIKINYTYGRQGQPPVVMPLSFPKGVYGSEAYHRLRREILCHQKDVMLMVTPYVRPAEHRDGNALNMIWGRVNDISSQTLLRASEPPVPVAANDISPSMQAQAGQQMALFIK